MNNHNPVRILLPLAVLFFLFSFLQPVSATPGPGEPDLTAIAADTAGIEAYAKGVFNKITEKNRFISALTSEDMGTLPVGLVREIGGKTYVIAIDSARMTTKGAYFNAYFRFTFPGTQSELIFGGKDIAFTPGGISGGTSTKLVLLNKKNIKINEHLDIAFPGDGSNFIEWDCNGFKSANLTGVFEFDKAWLEPEDTKMDKLRATLNVKVSDLSNIMAVIDMPAFHIGGLKDFSFKVKNATVDMSDMANPAGLKVTGDMLEDAGSPLLWRGFYLQEMEVGLPQQMASKEGRPKVTVTNFYIDDQGISGAISAENIVKLGDASAGGWPLSIDKVGLNFSRNKLNGGALGGQLQIDFLGDDPLAYDAAISMRNGDAYYSFSLKTTADKQFKFFAGNITLSKDSRIEITKTEKDFVPKATLNGRVDLNQSVLKVKNITFQDLVISTQKPYVHSGTFDFSTGGDSKVSNFPIGFDDLHIGISEGKVAIGATVRLSFMSSGDKGFAGSTSFIITAKQEEKTQTVIVDNETVTKTTTKWKLDKLTISDIELEVKVMAFKIKGILTLFDDHPVYGNGFRGFLDFSIPGPIPKAKATAYFGSKDNYKYWHVDVYIGVRIPIPPMLQITGLMGGMSYHMERPSTFDPYDTRNALDEKGGLPKEVNEIFQYVPSADAGLGFIGGVSLALATEMVVNANVSLEVQFGIDGGFRYAQFDGAGYILHTALKAKSKDEAGEDEAAPVWVQFKMRFDNVNHTFDANMKAYINILGVLKGIHERGLVGESALHIGPDDWWFYVGRPSSMFGVSILGLAEIKTYFMMGTKVEDMPQVPQEVQEVFEGINTDFMAMENSMSTGKGLGFGAHFRVAFSFDYGVYGEFALGAGSDILLRNYGEARCKGSNSIIGFNGWYASGQAYVFMKGDVGIRAKVFGRRRSFSIAKMSAAILLQAKLPNPAWFRGMAGVKYSILGGMIKGSANIKIELGTQCEILGEKELQVQVISDIRPDDQTSDISVFAVPQVAFNMPVALPFSMLNEWDEVATYRIKLDEFKLLNNKTEIKGEVVISADGKSATLNQRDVLPPMSKLTASARVFIERQNGSTWDALKVKGQIDYESKAVNFTTGEAPDFIPWENIAYTYPVKGQYNFLPKEYKKGYIKLKKGQPYLFDAVDAAGKKWKVNASFNPTQGAAISTDVAYDAAMTQVDFNIPDRMAKEAIYTYSVVRKSLDGEAAAGNVASKENTTVSENGDETTITETSLKGTANSGASKEVIGYSFRTSRFNTFAEKMSDATDVRDMFDIATGYISVIGQRFDMNETFDKFEMEGDATLATQPMVVLRAGTNNSWLQNKIMPLLYNGYPFQSSMTISRDVPATGGISPLGAVRLYNSDEVPYKLETSAVTDGIALAKPGRCRFMYYVSFVANQDYVELLNKANRLYVTTGNAPDAVKRLMTSTFPDLDGNLYYPVEFQYRLPGSNNISSTLTKSIYYKL